MAVPKGLILMAERELLEPISSCAKVDARVMLADQTADSGERQNRVGGLVHNRKMSVQELAILNDISSAASALASVRQNSETVPKECRESS